MQVDVSNKYGQIYRFILFSAGIACIYPLSFPICFLALIGFYWVDKYLLLRRYVTPFKLGYRTTSKLQQIMSLFPVSFSTTNLIIMFIPVGDGTAFENGKYSKVYYYLALAAFILSLAFYLFGNEPLKNLIECVLRIKRNYAALSE